MPRTEEERLFPALLEAVGQSANISREVEQPYSPLSVNRVVQPTRCTPMCRMKFPPKVGANEKSSENEFLQI